MVSVCVAWRVNWPSLVSKLVKSSEHKVLNSTMEFTICNILLLHLWICIEVMHHSWNLMLHNVSLIYTKQNLMTKKIKSIVGVYIYWFC